MSALGVEDVLQHAPIWIEDDYDTSVPWKTMLDYSTFPSLEPLFFDNERTALKKKDAAISSSSESMHRLHLSKSLYMISSPTLWACEDCSHGFTQRRSLSRHVRSVHEKRQRFPCPECGSSFLRSDILERHRREKHRKIEPVECMRCGKLVKDRSLDEHLKSRACVRHTRNIEHEATDTTSSAEHGAAMLTAIFEQSEEDRRLFESFNAGTVCNALSASSYLSYKAAQGWKASQSDSETPVAERDKEAELCHLRGLTIRSIIRSLAYWAFRR